MRLSVLEVAWGKVHENFHVLRGSFLEKEFLVEALHEFDVGNFKLR